MNKKQLARAHKFVVGSYVQYFPYRREVVTDNHFMSVGPRAGHITNIVRAPTQTDYGLFEVTWTHQVNQPTVEVVPGNKLCFST